MNLAVKKIIPHPTLTELKEGILLVDKPPGRTSFSLIRSLRKLTGIKKIGHAGTLDPFATGVMVLLVGPQFTKFSNRLLFSDKEYSAKICLGMSTDSFDCDGKVMARSKKVPSLEEIEHVIAQFQGEVEQVPPMFSAKKVKGKPLYKLARQGIVIERKPCKVSLNTTLLEYTYPYLTLKVACSKGTYIRTLAHDIGDQLGCGAHLAELMRTKSGSYTIDQCIDGRLLDQESFDITPHLLGYSDEDLSS